MRVRLYVAVWKKEYVVVLTLNVREQLPTVNTATLLDVYEGQ